MRVKGRRDHEHARAGEAGQYLHAQKSDAAGSVARGTVRAAAAPGRLRIAPEEGRRGEHADRPARRSRTARWACCFMAAEYRERSRSRRCSTRRRSTRATHAGRTTSRSCTRSKVTRRSRRRPSRARSNCSRTMCRRWCGWATRGSTRASRTKPSRLFAKALSAAAAIRRRAVRSRTGRAREAGLRARRRVSRESAVARSAGDHHSLPARDGVSRPRRSGEGRGASRRSAARWPSSPTIR